MICPESATSFKLEDCQNYPGEKLTDDPWCNCGEMEGFHIHLGGKKK